MRTLQTFAAFIITLAFLAFLGFGGYYIFRYAAGTFRDLEPYLTPAVKAGLVAVLLGAAVVALAARASAARRSADVLRLEKTRLFGRALDALAAGTDLASLERQLALLAGGAVIRAWRDVRADATSKGMAKLVRAMRRELGERGVFDDDALADLVGARRTEPTAAEMRAAVTAS